MPLSGAERSRQYRQRMKTDTIRHQAYLLKERERYNYKKETGQVQLVGDLSERDKRKRRKYWRHIKRVERTKTSEGQESPSTLTNAMLSPIESSEKKKRGRKRTKKERSVIYRRLEKLENELKTQKRMNEKLRKRLYRAKVKAADPNSPRTKVKMMFKGKHVVKQAKRMLLFHNVLIEGIKQKYKMTKSEKHKQLITKGVICSQLLKRYRLQKLARDCLEITHRRTSLCETNVSHMKYTRKIQKNALVSNMKKQVEDFLIRDDNSRVKAGKKSTKTKFKQKKQVQLLNDTMKNLHMKFLSEFKDSKMSYAMFCRLRPFYVRSPTEKDRETCLCKRHENLQFKAYRLKEEKLIQTANIVEIAKQIVCDTTRKECMYGTCIKCKTKTLEINQVSEEGKMVNYYEWKTKRQEIQLSNGDTKMTSITVKEKETLTLKVLCEEFEQEMKKCCSHIYNIEHQFKAIRHLKEKLTKRDVLIHIDFSENLICKYQSEIQSVHFGASQKQVSLHTGVMYTSSKTLPFCTVSDNLSHNPVGIWAHLRPVLLMIKDTFPDIENLNFLSDGPTTQYKNKENFFMMASVPFDFQFKSVNWSFTEAGHGKGAPDGVGAVIKREADRLVSHGEDITSADTLYNSIRDKLQVKMFNINEEDFSMYTSSNRTLQTIKGTMKIHQVFTTTRGSISFRDVSCFCQTPGTCICFSPTSYHFNQPLPEPVSGIMSVQSTDVSDVPTQQVQQAEDQQIPCTPYLQPKMTESAGSVEFEDSFRGQYCVVSYDNKPYPGIITDIDDQEIEVNVMHSVGVNRFFWPMIQDVLWYSKDHFIAIIPTPNKIGTRHFQIDTSTWDFISNKLDL